MTRVPLQFISPEDIARSFKAFRGLGRKGAFVVYKSKQRFLSSGLTCKREDYFLASLFSSLLFGGSLFLLIFILMWLKGDEWARVILISVSSGGGIGAFFFLVYLRYPAILSTKKAQEIERHLIFAMKDLLLHTSSGASLYEAIVSVAKSDYGVVSKELYAVAQAINSGIPTDKALERLAENSDSDYLKKIMWQIVNTLRAGGNLKESLEIIVNNLIQAQRVNIVSYANELNLWSLIYMLFAVAAPTIGLTMMIILSSFADIGINKPVLILFIGITTFIQIVIVSLIKARRPAVEF